MDKGNEKRDFCTCWWLMFLTMACVLVLSTVIGGMVVNENNYYITSFFAELSIFLPVFWGYVMLKKRNEENGIGVKKFPVRLIPYLVILPIVAQPFINMLTIPLTNLTEFLFGIEDVVTVTPGNWSEWIFAILTLCVVAPIVEEFLCRGIMMQYAKNYGVVVALVTTSVVFAMLHFSPSSFVILFFLGFLIGVVRIITDSIWACVLMHSVNNLVAFFLGIISETADVLYIVLLVLAIVLFPLTLYLFLKKTPSENREKIIYKPIKQKGFSAGMLLCFLTYGIYSILLMAINLTEKFA